MPWICQTCPLTWAYFLIGCVNMPSISCYDTGSLWLGYSKRVCHDHRQSHAQGKRHVEIPSNVPTLTTAKIGYAAELLAIVVLGLSKVTACIFYGSLFSQMQHRSNRIAFAGMIIWMVMAMLLLAIRCSHGPWYDISATRCGSLVRKSEKKLRVFGVGN
jgi:hypothetical protein